VLQQRGLSGLAGPVTALEGDPESGHEVAAAFFAALAARVAAAFLAAAERAAAFSASVFAAFAVVFFAAVFVAVVFLAVVVFFAVDVFLAVARPRLGAGPFARLSASICTATSKVMSAGVCPRGMVTFVSPSVT